MTVPPPPFPPGESEVAEWLHLFDSWLNQEGRQTPSAEGVPPDDVQARVERGLECLKRLKVQWPAPSASACFETGPDGLTRFGRFEIRGEIGRGGFGVVYRAFDPHLDREVALKVPRRELAGSDDLAQRFHLEALAAARLDHPGLVPVLDAGTVGATSFIVSPYFPGTTLAAWLGVHRRAPCPREAARLVSSLADAVSHAHSRGVLHRDLKPANILLVAETVDPKGLPSEHHPLERYTPKVTDFGLAKFLFDDSGVTKTGAILGTSSYMAPEQATGRLKDVSTATDVYALGAILYEAITGRPPFAGETTQETLEQIRGVDPKPPRAVRADVPLDLQTICLKCLRKEPHERYGSAADLADDLGRFLDGRPVRARRVSPRERLLKWCRRRPVVTALIALLALAILAGTTTSLFLFGKASRSRERLLASLAELVNAVGNSPVLSDPEQNEYYKSLVKQWELLIQEENEEAAKEKVVLLIIRLAKLEQKLGNRESALASAGQAVQMARVLHEHDPGNADYNGLLSYALLGLSRVEPDRTCKLRQLREAISLVEGSTDKDTFVHLASLHNDLGVELGEGLADREARPEQLAAFGEAERYVLLAIPDLTNGWGDSPLSPGKRKLAVQVLINIYDNQALAYLGGKRPRVAPAAVAAEKSSKYASLFMKLYPQDPTAIDFMWSSSASLSFVYQQQRRDAESVQVLQRGFQAIEGRLPAYYDSPAVMIKAYVHLGTLSFNAAMALRQLFEASGYRDANTARQAAEWFNHARHVNHALRLMKPLDEERARQYGLCWANLAEIHEKLGEKGQLRFLLKEATESYDLFIDGAKKSIARQGALVREHEFQRARSESLLCAQLWVWYARVLAEHASHDEAESAWRRAREHIKYGWAIKDKAQIKDFLDEPLYELAVTASRRGQLGLASGVWLQWCVARAEAVK